MSATHSHDLVAVGSTAAAVAAADVTTDAIQHQIVTNNNNPFRRDVILIQMNQLLVQLRNHIRDLHQDTESHKDARSQAQLHEAKNQLNQELHNFASMVHSARDELSSVSAVVMDEPHASLPMLHTHATA